MNSPSSLTSFVLKPGTRIGENVIINPVAEGGMAHIYKVKNETLEVIRVIKLLKPGSDIDSERFLTEAKIHANLNHPNIVQCYSFGKYKEVIPYIEMEYVNGTNLYHLIHNHGRMPIPVVVSIIYYVCKALQALHNCTYTLYNVKRSGVVHRDIKPSNIIISTNGNVKLADFGIAKPKDLAIHTSEIQVVGSIYYLSPEQLKKEELDFSTDIYSLGCVIYEMITAIKAFDHNNISDIVMAKVKNSYSMKPLKNCPDRIRNILTRSLNSNKKERFETIEEVLKIIETHLKTLSIENPEQVIKQYIQNPKNFFVLFEQTERQNKKPRKFTVFIPFFIVLTIITSFGILLLLKNQKTDRTNAALNKPGISFVPAAPDSLSSQDTSIVKREASRTKAPVQLSYEKAATNINKTDKKNLFEAAYSAFLQNDFNKCISILSNKNNLNDTLFLCYLGALWETGKFDKLSELINTRVVTDGYYDYIKGKADYANKNFESAVSSFMKSLTIRSFYQNLQYYSNYYLAKSKAEIYLKVPSIENKNRMVKSLEFFAVSFCKNPNRQECADIIGLLKKYK